MRRVLALSLALVGLLAAGVAAAAERRVALVVGNSSYPSAPLANPRNDASDVADALAGLGFDVIRHVDAGRNDINDALEEFQRKASDADAVLFYYAGHAMQYDGQNYLMPVDAVLRDQYSVPQLTSLSRVKDALSTCGECVKIMILDACRNNPLADQFLKEQVVKNRSLSQPARGLARLSEKPDGLFAVFATQAGDVAADGEGRNSPFTQALLTELKKPELGLSELFNDVALDVKTATGKTQVPEISYSAVRTLDHFYINQNEGDNTAFEKLDYSDIGALRHFIELYPGSSKRRFVENLIGVMERQTRERADEAQQAAERDRLRDEARQKADADRLRDEARQKADADRLQQEAEEEAQRKLEEERVRLAAEAKLKAESDRSKKEAEAQRQRDPEHLRVAVPAVASQAVDPVRQPSGSTSPPQRQGGAAPDTQQRPGKQSPDSVQPAGAVEAQRRDHLPQTSLGTACKVERARFVVLKQHGPSALNALAAFKSHLVCGSLAPEVQAAIEADASRAAAPRQGDPPHRTYARVPQAEKQPGPALGSSNPSQLEPALQQALRSYRERNHLDDVRPYLPFSPAPAASASEPSVGSGF